MDYFAAEWDSRTYSNGMSFYLSRINKTGTWTYNGFKFDIPSSSSYDANFSVVGVKDFKISRNSHNYLNLANSDGIEMLHEAYLSYGSSYAYRKRSLHLGDDEIKLFYKTNSGYLPEKWFLIEESSIEIYSGRSNNYSKIEQNDTTVVISAKRSSWSARSLEVDSSNGTSVTGDFDVSGTKNRRVSTPSYGEVLMDAYETTSPMFGDVGEAKTDNSGICVVAIDDIFREVSRTDIEYQVFLQKEGQGDLWIDEKHPAWFTVRGTANLKFAWEIKAKQRDYELNRTERKALKNISDDYVFEDYESFYEEEINYVKEQEDIFYDQTA